MSQRTLSCVIGSLHPPSSDQLRRREQHILSVNESFDEVDTASECDFRNPSNENASAALDKSDKCPVCARPVGPSCVLPGKEENEGMFGHIRSKRHTRVPTRETLMEIFPPPTLAPLSIHMVVHPNLQLLFEILKVALPLVQRGK